MSLRKILSERKSETESSKQFSFQKKRITTNKKTSAEYLAILQKLKKSFTDIRALEVAALTNFTIDYRKIINEASMSVDFEVSKLKQIILSLQNEKAENSKKLEKSANKLEQISVLFSSLKAENSRVKEENQELKKNIESAKVAQRNMKLEVEELKEDCVKKTSLSSCLKELQSEKENYRGLFPQVSKLQTIIESIRSSEISKLVKGYKIYKDMYKKHLKIDSKNQMAIRRYHRLILEEQKKVMKIGGMVKARFGGEDSCDSMRRGLSTALKAVRKYKSSVESQEDELAYCRNQSDQYERVLRSTNTFYSYLLQKIGQVSGGIHHLKIVGERMR